MFRVASGLVMGGLVGVAVVAVVVLTKFGPLVNTPRSMHGVLIGALIALPALVGAAAGHLSRRAS